MQTSLRNYFCYCSFALMQKNQKIKAPEKWLKFISLRYSEEAYYRLLNIYCA